LRTSTRPNQIFEVSVQPRTRAAGWPRLHAAGWHGGHGTPWRWSARRCAGCSRWPTRRCAPANSPSRSVSQRTDRARSGHTAPGPLRQIQHLRGCR